MITLVISGGQDASRGGHRIRHPMAPLQTDASVQLIRGHVVPAQVHGPLVHHVCEDLRFHQ